MTRHTRWKMERGESTWHKLNRARKFTPFNRVEQASILGITFITVIMLGFFGYYELNVAPYLPNGNQRNDPFTQLWNGTITDSPVGPFGPPRLLASFVHAGFSGAASQTQAITVTSGNLIVVSITQSNSACSTATVTDSQGNTIGGSGQYGRIAQQNSNNLICVQARWAFASATGADTITVLTGGTNGQAFQVLVYGGVATLPQSGGTFTGQVKTIAQFPATATSGFTSLIFNPFGKSSVVFELWSQATDFGCATANSGTTTSVNKNCQTGLSQIFSDYTWSTNSFPKTNQTITWSEGGSDSLGENSIAALAFEIPSQPIMPCPAGYQCLNAGVDSFNLLNMNPNSTIAGIALTTSPVDLSTAASKELLFFETWNNATNIVGQPFGWYLTKNSTLPGYIGYNPLNDPSVVSANIVYPVGGASSTKNYYSYQSKTTGQLLFAASGTTTNPYPSCPQSATLYICSQGTSGFGTSFKDLSMTVNYTGTAPGSANQGSAGASLTCSDSTPAAGPNTYDFCLAAYSSSPCPTATAPACSTRVLPLLNANGGPYYIGFWSAANQTGTIEYGTTNAGAFDRRANSFFVWVPNPCGGTAVNCVQSTSDTGGFFGWLGRSLGAAWNAAGDFLSPVLAPIVGFGNSFMIAIISAFIQTITVLMNAFRQVLNGFGNFLHMGNIGDLLFSFFNLVGTTIIGIYNMILSFIAFVYAFFTNGYSNFVTGGISLLASLVPIFITLWLLVLNINFSISTLLFFDFTYGSYRLYNEGMDGLFEWINFNRFIFTFIFDILWYVFDSGTRSFLRIKQMLAQWV